MSKEKTTNIITPEFRASYVHITKPNYNKLAKKDEYSVEARFAKGANLSALQAAAQAALEEKFGADKTKWPKNLRNPFRDQADKVKIIDGKEVLPDGYERGAIYMNLRTAQRPGVVDSKVQPILDESQIYSGCYMRATVNAYAYDQGGNRGVAFSLVNLQKMRDGEPLSGRMKAEDSFSAVNDGSETEATSAVDLFK